MALKINGTTSQTGLGNLLKEGTRHMQGVEEAVNRNIAACRQLCEIVRSSFGPCGLNKLVVNGLDQIFLTNDAGVIVRELEVEHPAARLLLLASQQQQREYGDATNFVLILAGEMLSLAEDLLRIGLKPSQIVEGYEVAVRLLFRDLNCEIDGQKVSLIESLKFYPTNESLESILRSTIASKHYGNEGILTKLVVDAISIVKTENRISNTSDSGPNLTIDPENIHIVKVLGGSLSLSTTFRGMLLGREPFGRVHSIQNAKIAVFACPINTSRTETKGTVLIKDAEQLLSFGKGEEAILAAQISSIAAVGVNVIVCGDVIGELALHYIERAGIMAIRLTSKFDVRRVCRATGATPLARLGSPTLEEIGSCLAVETVEVGGTRGTLFRQDTISSRIINSCNLATIVLRSNTQSQLDDMERTLRSAILTARNVFKDKAIVPGAGAFEAAIAVRMANLADLTPGLLQHALKAYAASFYAIPRQLACNAGQVASSSVDRIESAHLKALTVDSTVSSDSFCSVGINIESTSSDANALTANSGVLELFAVKKSAIELASDAVITLLRVDQIIMAKQANGPKARPAGPQDDDDMA